MIIILLMMGLGALTITQTHAINNQSRKNYWCSLPALQNGQYFRLFSCHAKIKKEVIITTKHTLFFQTVGFTMLS